MEKLQKQYDIDVHWHSFELRPAGSPPISQQYQARIEASRPMLEKRAREQYDLTMNVGPFGIDSRPALIVEKYAETQGKGEAFHKAVMQAYWQQARSIDEKAVLQEIAEQVGLSTENFDDVLASPSFDEEVAADVELAHEYGLTGVPALIFADRYLVVGAQPFETFKRLVEKILEEA